MEVRCEVTQADVRALARVESSWMRAVLRLSAAMLPAIVLLGLFQMWVALAAFGVTTVLVGGFIRWGTRSAANQVKACMTYRLDRDSWCVSGDGARSRYSWSSLDRVIETRDHVFLVMPERRTFVVPKRAFRSPEERSTFVRLLEEGVRNASARHAPRFQDSSPREPELARFEFTLTSADRQSLNLGPQTISVWFIGVPMTLGIALVMPAIMRPGNEMLQWLAGVAGGGSLTLAMLLALRRWEIAGSDQRRLQEGDSTVCLTARADGVTETTRGIQHHWDWKVIERVHQGDRGIGILVGQGRQVCCVPTRAMMDSRGEAFFRVVETQLAKRDADGHETDDDTDGHRHPSEDEDESWRAEEPDDEADQSSRHYEEDQAAVIARERRDRERQRAAKTDRWLFTYGVLGGLVFAAIAIGPALYWEHLRIEPWAWIGLWLGDLVALVWYIGYLATMRDPTSHETIEQIPKGQVPVTGVAWTVGLVAFTAAAGIGLDLWFTYRMHSIEVDAMARAIPAIGQVTMIAQRSGTQNTCHRITVAYKDQQGRPVVGEWEVNESKQNGFPAWLAKEDVRAIQGGRVPFAFGIKFDPDWPGRFWPAGLPELKGGLLFYWSLMVNLFQGLFVLIFLVFVYDACHLNDGGVQAERMKLIMKSIPLMALASVGWLCGLLWLLHVCRTGQLRL